MGLDLISSVSSLAPLADVLVPAAGLAAVGAGLAAIGLLVLLILVIGHAAIGPATLSKTAGGTDNLSGIATLIFTAYVFPFEVTGALLITAAGLGLLIPVAAIVLFGRRV